MFASIPQGRGQGRAIFIQRSEGSLVARRIRKGYVEEGALEDEADLETEQTCRAVGHQKITGRLESVGTLWCLMWSELRHM